MATGQFTKTEFKDLAGFPGYRIGSDGSVWCNLPRNWVAKPPFAWRPLRWKIGKKTRYAEVTVRDSRRKPRMRLVHRLVLETFVGPCPEGMECRHLDGVRLNNALENLCWGTRQQNMEDRARHGTMVVGESCNLSKLTEKQVRAIRDRYATGLVTQTALAAEFGVAQTNISDIVRRKSWKHVV